MADVSGEQRPGGIRGRRPRRSVFFNLFLAMSAFGLIIGLVLPPFAVVVLGVNEALSVYFFTMCIAAGMTVALVNFLLFRLLVFRAVDRVAAGMRTVLQNVRSTGRIGADEGPRLEVSSNDAVGRIEEAFNEMTGAIERRIDLEWATRSLLSSLSASVELKEVAQKILSSMVETAGAKAGLVYCDTGEAFELAADFGIDRTDGLPPRLSLKLGPVSSALESGKIVTLSPKLDGLDWMRQSTPLGEFVPRSIVFVPLTTKGQAAGVAILACDFDELQPDQKLMIETLRTQGTPHLQNAVLHGKISDLAAIDDLTRILNRRFGIRRLQEEFSRSVRTGVPVSVVMLDVDHFKRFNDTHGHDAGDAVLRMVATTVEKNVRAGDVTCRYGGEEFIVTEPGAGVGEASAIAERLRALIQQTPMRWEGHELKITISLGVATWPIVPCSIPEELVTAADKALYHAKESGRNRVSVHRGDRVVPASQLDAGMTT
jgi:diguanylate cyclase (GGDEF)-like protein